MHLNICISMHKENCGKWNFAFNKLNLQTPSQFLTGQLCLQKNVYTGKPNPNNSKLLGTRGPEPNGTHLRWLQFWLRLQWINTKKGKGAKTIEKTQPYLCPYLLNMDSFQLLPITSSFPGNLQYSFCCAGALCSIQKSFHEW